LSVGTQTVVKVTLNASVSDLDEVVVVGYGEVTRRDLTGSISSIKPEDNVFRQYNSVDALLQGRVSGIQVNTNAGLPGQAANVRIRGLGTLSANTEPLYVIDGIIVNSANEEVVATNSVGSEIHTPQNGLMGINPRDIAHIEVLKDASATAIYGSRGANGVVLITTKGGQAGDKASINVYSNTSMSYVTKKLPIMDAPTYARYRNELLANGGSNPMYKIDGSNIYPITYSTNPETGIEEEIIGEEPFKQYDWQDEMFVPGLTLDEGITVSGKNGATSYYFSSGYKREEGIVKNSTLTNGNIRLNLTQKLTERLLFDIRLNANLIKLSFPDAGRRNGPGLINTILRFRPLINETVETIDWNNDVSNPYGWVNDYDDLSDEIRFNGVTKIEYALIEGLKYQFQLGLDYRNKERSKWYGITTPRGSENNGNLGISLLDRYAYTMNHLLNYNKEFNSNHRLNAVLGFTYDGQHSKNSNEEFGNFPLKSLRAKSPQSAQVLVSPLSYAFADEKIASGLFRANYSFLNRYVLTATMRSDGSSKFATGQKWGFFPAAAFAWQLGQESWVKELGIFDDLKLRLSWGVTGNQSISAYSTLNRYINDYYADPSNNSQIALRLAGITNRNLKWETTKQANIGLDATFWDNRIQLTVDAYQRNTHDLLQMMSIGLSNGFTAVPVNLGDITNNGIETALNMTVIDKDNVVLSLGGNIGFNRNKVARLGLAPASIFVDGVLHNKSFYFGDNIATSQFKQSVNMFMEGYPIGVFWGLKSDGIYQTEAEAATSPTFYGIPSQAGDMVFLDLNEDGNIDDNDKTLLGNPNPDFTFGFNVNFTYKRFSLSALFEGNYGNEIVNGNLSRIGYPFGATTNSLAERYTQAWRPEAPTNPYPRLDWTHGASTFFDGMVEDGTYLRLNQVTVSYDFDIKLRWIHKTNLFMTGRNLFTWTNYSGYDPSITTYMFNPRIMGVDWLSRPNVRSFVVGLSLVF